MRCLVLAPHQDDEIVLCGLIMNSIKAMGYDVFIVFLTNGNYDQSVHDIRIRESLEVAGVYGIDDNHVIFLGYANEYCPEGPHIYNAPKGMVVSSQYGTEETYGIPEHPEYCFKRYGVHHKYTRNNIYSDLKDIIGDLRPELIISTGEEVHPDHAANSLLLDETLGDLMHSYPDYRPIVLKKPEYHTAWIGEDDYSRHNNPSAKFDFRNRKVFVNGTSAWFFDPYLRWQNRIRLPIDRDAEGRVKKALATYASQKASNHFGMLLNSDVVFWLRRTDSLTYSSNVSASSGNAKYINDFKRNDSRDIRRKVMEAWVQDASIWRPNSDDSEPRIDISFGNKHCVDRVVVYQEYNTASTITECSLLSENNREIWRGGLRRFKETVICFSPVETNKISLKIHKYSGKVENVGVSEIEVYPTRSTRTCVLKALINDNFVYDYEIELNKRQHLSIYAVSDIGESVYYSANDCTVNVFDESGQSVQSDMVFDKCWNIITGAFENKRLTVEVTKDDLSDRITIEYPEVNSNGEVYFIGTPNHWNSGDHFIAQATLDFIHNVLGNIVIKEIQIREFEESIPELVENITKRDLIIMQGGGNMGNVYPSNEMIRRRVFSMFPYNRIIVFPETIHYENTAEGAYEKQTSVKVYSDAKHLTICAREKESYKQMLDLYSNNRIVLVPDIVCSMELKLDEDINREGAALFYRDDGEKVISGIIDERVRKELDIRNISYSYGDMIYNRNRGYSGKANRQVIIRSKLREITQNRIVITDRMHAMILCVMTGTPCVVFYGYNHKIPSMYDSWFKDVPYITLITYEDDIGEAIDRVLEAPVDCSSIRLRLKGFFEPLVEVLKGDEGIDAHLDNCH